LALSASASVDLLIYQSRLIHYTLEPNPTTEDDQNALPQKLSLAFSTADVVILG